MCRDRRLENLARREPRMRRFFVAAHQKTVARDIGTKDRGQLAFQRCHPPDGPLRVLYGAGARRQIKFFQI